MAPFDFSQGDDDLMNGTSFIGHKSWVIDASERCAPNLFLPPVPTILPAAPSRPPLAVKLDAKRSYPLVDNARIAAPDAEQALLAHCSKSMRTPFYFEYLLQILDKNATITSIVLLLVYAGILAAM